MLAAFLTTCLFALSGITGVRLTQYFQSAAMANLCRLIVAAAILGVWAHGFGDGAFGPSFSVFFISGMVGFGFGDVALFQAFRQLGSRLTIMIVHCFAAPIAALTEWAWMGVSLSVPQILSVGVTLGGVAVALYPAGSEAPSKIKRNRVSGYSWATLAAMGQGLGAVLSRRGYQLAEENAWQIDAMTTAYHRLLGGIVVSALCVALIRRFRKATPTIVHGWFHSSRIFWIGANALTGPALGVACFQWALVSAPTGVVLPIVALTPIVLMPITRYTENDRPTQLSILGAIAAVSGVILLQIAT